MSFMQFKVLKKFDLHLVQQLAHQIWNEYYPEIIGQEQVDFMLGSLYSLSSLEDQIDQGQKFILITDESGIEIGFIAISEKEKQEWFIHKFYILGSKQNKGIGQAVFNQFLEDYTPKIVRLQVNRQNFKAINFYFKVGFTIERVADFDIGHGYFMNDFIMIWQKNT